MYMYSVHVYILYMYSVQCTVYILYIMCVLNDPGIIADGIHT